MSGMELRLYVAGGGPNSARARANLRSLVERHLPAEPRIEVVDMLAGPCDAEADGILVTPTLVRLFPEPRVRIIGDLGDTAAVLAALEVVGM